MSPAPSWQSNGRTSLCADHTIFDLVAIDSVDSFRKSIDRLITEGLPNHRFESRVNGHGESMYI